MNTLDATAAVPFMARESFIELTARERARALLDAGTFRELLGPFDRLTSPWLPLQGIVCQADDGAVIARGTIDGAAANMSTLQAAIEGHMADLDRSIAELGVWNGQAAAECQARNQEIKSAWASIQQQLGHMTTQTNRFNEDARITEDAIYRSFSSR